MSAQATLVITTKNRRDDLRTALLSAQTQSVSLELLIIDDGSTDGTSEMVREEFPSAQLHRFETSRGLIAQRNRGAQLATTPIILSMDDDAAFVSPETVAQTLREFDDERVGAVAMPFVDVRYGPEIHNRAPAEDQIYATEAFRGTAHALRREVFLQLGGYREQLIHQGEERDFCLRLLNAGYITRAGSADPLHHFESPRRDTSRMDFYGRRNDVLFAWHNLPRRVLFSHLLGTIVNGIRFGLRVRRPLRMLKGLGAGLFSLARERSARAPVSLETYYLHRELRSRRAIPLREIEGRLVALSEG
jgi:glycosyltransferase involved in cell wall biosynthesis